jgi:predicted nuclease with TOPRIM domain
VNDTTPLYTADQMDVLRNRIEKLEKEKSILFDENEQLREVAAKLQTNAGFKPASELNNQEQEGEAKITDAKLLTNFVMDALKLKPREVIIKWHGKIVMEIKPIV